MSESRTYKEILNELKVGLEKVLEHFKTEIAALRTARATPALVENIKVDYYGTPTPLKHLAAISTPQPRYLVIQPWDKNAVQPIEKALSQSKELGASPVVDGQLIKLNLPPLTEERRNDLVKIINDKSEESRVAIRLQREKAWKEIQDLEKGGAMREDDKFRAKDELQKMIDDYNEKVQDVRESKEKEIMSTG